MILIFFLLKCYSLFLFAPFLLFSQFCVHCLHYCSRNLLASCPFHEWHTVLPSGHPATTTPTCITFAKYVRLARWRTCVFADVDDDVWLHLPPNIRYSLLSFPPSPLSHAHLLHSVTTCCDFLARLFSCDNNFINVFYRSLFIRYHFPQHLKFWKLFFAIVQLFHVLISLSLLLCCNSIILCLFSLCITCYVPCSRLSVDSNLVFVS